MRLKHDDSDNFANLNYQGTQSKWMAMVTKRKMQNETGNAW